MIFIKTPLQLARSKGDDLADIYLNVLKTAYNKDRLSPKFVNISDMSMTIPDYPLLKPNPNWTKNDPKYFSGYKNKEKFGNIQNLIDGDPHTICTFGARSYNWVIFDLKSEHVISKIRIYAWKSDEMPKECFLQVSNSVE